VRGAIEPAALRSPAEEDSVARHIGPRGWIGPDSPLWLVLVAGLFTLAELTPSLMRLPLGADEITYIAQTSAHASQIILPPVHSRGAGLLAAPVTLLTTSLLALRIWMALLSGAGLFLALLAWRGLRPAWVLAVAGAVLGSLGIAQLSAVQAMPDWWVALGALTLVGLFLQAVNGRMRPKVVFPLLAAVTFFLVLMRPQDAAFLLAPVIVAVFLVPAWWDHRLLYAFGAGIVAAGAEWIGEAYAWYGGPDSRLHMMGQEPPKFGFYFTLPYQLRVLNGPWYCRPGECTDWDYPWLTIWWVALLALVVLGVFVVGRTSLTSSAITVVPALSLLAAYTLFVPYAAPRYLLPVIALLAIPAADGIAWLCAAPRWRVPAVLLTCAFLLVGIVSQQFVRKNEVADQTAARTLPLTRANHVRSLGVDPPCVTASSTVAYYLGCGSPWTGESMREYLNQTPGGRNAWVRLSLPAIPPHAYVRR
jgi:hypothetical protein